MMSVRMICVGKLREPFYRDAFAEYAKRLGGYCRFECTELQEVRLPDQPSAGEIAAALDKEADLVVKSMLQGSYIVALCVEGRKLSSEDLASVLRARESSGKPKICFVIGSSYGLSDKIKRSADLCLSMSDMTFPHHLARVMLAEQIYRGFKINEGSSYHK